MATRSPSRLPILAVVLAALGCRAVLPKSATSEFFVLTVVERAPAGAPTTGAPSVLLGRVVLPEYLDRRELVTRLASNQLRVEDLELWAEPLRDSVPRTIEHDLAASLAGERVEHLPWTGASPPDLVVSVEVNRFEKTAAGSIELVAGWTISDARKETGETPERLRQETRLSYTTAEKTTQAAVASMSQTLAILSREIAAGVQRVARSQASADHAGR